MAALPPLPLPLPHAPAPTVCYPLLCTRYSVIRYPLPLSLCPLPHCPCHMSWPRFAARPNDNCLSRSASVSLPLPLIPYSAAFVCLPVNQRFVVVVVMLPAPDRHLQLPHCQCRRCHPRKYFFENIFTYTIFVQLRNS